MRHRSIFHRIAWNWRVHGIPRCDGWFPMDEKPCRGLIWPWQDTGGNGESAEHMACSRKREAQRKERDRLDAIEWAKAADDPDFTI